MTKIESNEVEVRPAVKEDIASIHSLIAELADFENLQHQFVATVEDLENGLSGEGRAAEAQVPWPRYAQGALRCGLFLHRL